MSRFRVKGLDVSTVRIGDMVQNRVLVTRASARSLGEGVAGMLHHYPEPIELDFRGIRGFTPSFFDELLHSMRDLARSQGRDLDLRIVNPPWELMSIHEAIGRAHGLSISESEVGSWLVGRPEMMEGTDPSLPVQT